MKKPQYIYRAASMTDIDLRWDKNIADNIGDDRWVAWKNQFIKDNQSMICKTFVALHGENPIGEGTLIFSPDSSEINGRLELADNISTVNINALRMDKKYEGKGHMSKLMKVMEQYAKDNGYKVVTIGVEAKETRTLAIYLHWGYTEFVTYGIEDNELALYYSKKLDGSGNS